MKKNTMMRVASALMIAVLLTTCAISGTFAKYTSEATGTAQATVAKWDVAVGGTKLGVASQTFTFDLFKTVLDTNGGAGETDVSPNRIAPGTKGSFAIVINNNSEVNVTYDMSLTIPAALQGIITFTPETTSGTIGVNESATINVTWEWPYEGDDADDTALGLSGSTYDIVANVTVTQVD